LIHFLDNAISPALMHALIANPPGPDWYSFARAEPELTDPDFCLALRRSGCVMLKLGLESGDQGVLDEMDKGIDLGMVAKTLANLEKAGIATYVYLLFGTPTESLPEARRTLEFTVKHASAITFLNLAIFNMPRFAPDAASLAKTAFYEGDLSLYTDFEHPRAWNRREIRRFLDREFKRHPAIAPIIRRDPPFFTSNHAPFLIPASSKTLGNSHL
ncbi:MAG: radical SAM protein, partial [Desulfurivibrionaceae bacterium]